MKPKSVEVYPVYICPDCHARYCESLEYINKVGKILCSCKKVLELDPIETFRMQPIYKSDVSSKISEITPVPPPKQDKDISDTWEKAIEKSKDQKIGKEEFEMALDLLVSLGWKKKEASDKVKKISRQWIEKENKPPVSSEYFEEFSNYLIFN